MHRRLFIHGLGIWVAATLALRFGGQVILQPLLWPKIIALFAVSLGLMALLARRLCLKAKLPAQAWPAGAISLAMPTLLLDPLSSAFFPVVFPNLSPDLGGVFGGWMLACCAGALLGAFIRPGSSR
jgi:hypothetical protein